jgi:hypothetical protein
MGAAMSTARILGTSACNPTGNVELMQAGLRYWVVPGRLQVDATYGESTRKQPRRARVLGGTARADTGVLP